MRKSTRTSPLHLIYTISFVAHADHKDPIQEEKAFDGEEKEMGTRFIENNGSGCLRDVLFLRGMDRIFTRTPPTDSAEAPFLSMLGWGESGREAIRSSGKGKLFEWDFMKITVDFPSGIYIFPFSFGW